MVQMAAEVDQVAKTGTDLQHIILKTGSEYTVTSADVGKIIEAAGGATLYDTPKTPSGPSDSSPMSGFMGFLPLLMMMKMTGGGGGA